MYIRNIQYPTEQHGSTWSKPHLHEKTRHPCIKEFRILVPNDPQCCALPGPPHRPWNWAIRLHHKALLFHKVRAVSETLICLREAYVAIPSVGEDVWLSVRVTEPKTKGAHSQAVSMLSLCLHSPYPTPA